MWETELVKFIILASIILLVFIWGILLFMFKYQKRKAQYEKTKAEADERHLRELLFTRIEIQQHTMQDIGREIHDNVGQRLTLASLYTYQLEVEHKDSPVGERIAGIAEIINESMAELRSLSQSLTDANTENRDLKDLVATECSRMNALNMCQVSYEFAGQDIHAPAAMKIFIHRVLQEFLQNSMKHARCRQITVSLNNATSGLSVTLADDGVGFDMAAYTANSKKGIGLMNMKKRAEMLGAEMALESMPGKGTTLKVFIPATKLND